METNLLIVGNSHVQCLSSAAHHSAQRNVEVVNLSQIPHQRTASPDEIASQVVDMVKEKRPDAICLCIAGNEHNILGLIEDPLPISIGDAAEGAVPRGLNGRWFIPRAVAVDSFRKWLDFLPKRCKALYESFPEARRLYMMPPPPISDWSHILENPGVFADKIHLGPAPDELRICLYGIQIEVLGEAAGMCGAEIVSVDPVAVDGSGFLKRDFYGADPTHGNALYGNLMLTRILSKVQLVQ